MDRSVKHLLIISTLFTVLGTIGAFGITLYALYIRPQELALKKAAIVSGDGTAVIAKVSEFIDLPGNEIPTVAVIRGVDEVKNQPALAMAEPGDIVLVYPTSNIGIVYDPTREKLKNVGQLSVANQNGQVAGEMANKEENLEVLISDNLGSPDLSEKNEKLLLDFIPKLVLKDVDPSEEVYKQNSVIDLSKSNTVVTQNIAKALNGRVIPLSDNEYALTILEKNPNAKILIIYGTDTETSEAIKPTESVIE